MLPGGGKAKAPSINYLEIDLMAGAPLGNQNAKKGKVVTDGIWRSLARDDFKRFNEGCEKVADAFAAGEQWAVNFVADRKDGKPVQALEHSGPDGEAIETKNALSVSFVSPEKSGE